ncbi:hypothetical protein PBAL39_09136 [Pedobacter sp. BAL39]|uniref:asparagine synthase-related protein n=1 Tax=Pedobacter sp. BAL39 TaxID=391596 RepID=UPI00015599C1|nr:asparagine synthase-related protein [Pedobacter sp. BAL39]EDM37295.1 hypothetical protein PBAL39_09136 [Pedobacter sp. BAL39]
MSVIFGRCNFHFQPVTGNDLSIIEKTLSHWKSDDKGAWLHNATGLGHLMLYNTPESLTEKLPYHHAGSKLTITADARIDNRDELFSKLGVPAAEQLTIPDSLLILKAYEKYGTHAPAHLTGDFAFAIWDENEQKLFCARDQMGAKPFFYYCAGSFFAFASEKKGIIAIPGTDLTVNKQFLFNQLLRPPEQETDTTLYINIKRLKPAHTLLLDARTGGMHTQQYWDLDPYTELKFARKADYHDGLLHHFEQAVQCRTRSHYSVGTELSGGMDSSSITAVANIYLNQHQKELITFSNTLADEVTDPQLTDLDERRYINAVLEFNKIKNAVYITREAFDDQLEELRFAVEVNDGLERWNPLWQIPLKKKAMQMNVRTLLSGFPGDELVTYRGKYYFLDYLDKKQYLRYFLAKKKYPGFNKLEPLLSHHFKYQISQVKRAFNIWHRPREKEILEEFRIPDFYKRHMRDCIWLNPVYQEQFKSYRHFQRCRLLKPQVHHRMESESRYGIHFRTEPRFPMADIRLTQFYLSMPNEFKYEGELSRTFFRNTLSKYLPPMLMQRNDKYGSVAPFINRNRKTSNEQFHQLLDTAPEISFINKARYRQQGTEPRQSLLEILLWITKNKNRIEKL